MRRPKISIRTLFWITLVVAAFFAGRETAKPTIRIQQMEIRELKSSIEFIVDAHSDVYESVRKNSLWQPGMLDPSLVPIGLRQPLDGAPTGTTPVEPSSLLLDLPDSTVAPLE